MTITNKENNMNEKENKIDVETKTDKVIKLYDKAVANKEIMEKVEKALKEQKKNLNRVFYLHPRVKNNTASPKEVDEYKSLLKKVNPTKDDIEYYLSNRVDNNSKHQIKDASNEFQKDENWDTYSNMSSENKKCFSNLIKHVSKKHYLQELLDYLKTNETEFAKLIGENRTKINHILNFRNGISANLARKIIKKYPDVSFEWLRTGEGEMLIENEITEIEPSPFSLPLIPFDAVAGYSMFDNEGIRIEECERYVVPEFKNSGAEFVIRVSGSSMYPKYSSGDVLACKKITDILFFQWGKIYVIDSSQGILVKRVYKCENEDYVKLVSDNSERYDAFDIPKSDIRSLSIVLGVIRME